MTNVHTEFLRVIQFAIAQGIEASEFLDAWMHGDTEDWPEFTTHPQSTEPAPSTAVEQVDADDWVVREDILSMARATGAEEVIGNWLFYVTGSHLERFAAALLSEPALPAAAMPVGELTDEKISEIWESHVIPVFGRNGINPIVFARKLLAAARTQPVREPLATNDIRCECCGYMTHQREHLGCIRAAKK